MVVGNMRYQKEESLYIRGDAVSSADCGATPSEFRAWRFTNGCALAGRR